MADSPDTSTIRAALIEWPRDSWPGSGASQRKRDALAALDRLAVCLETAGRDRAEMARNSVVSLGGMTRWRKRAEAAEAALGAAREALREARGATALLVRAADRIAIAVRHRITLQHLDARSEAGDALLDYAGLDDHRELLGIAPFAVLAGGDNVSPEEPCEFCGDGPCPNGCEDEEREREAEHLKRLHEEDQFLYSLPTEDPRS